MMIVAGVCVLRAILAADVCPSTSNYVIVAIFGYIYFTACGSQKIFTYLLKKSGIMH